MYLTHALILALAAGSVLAQVPTDPGTSYMFRVDQATAGQRLLLHQHFDIPSACCTEPWATGPLEVIVQPEQLGFFRRVAPGAVLVARGRPFHEIRNEMLAAQGTDLPDLLYYTVAEIEAEIDAAAAAHPTRARKVDITALPGGMRTHENRPIFALKISDNVAVDEDEPAILIAAQHHARELNSPHMVIGAMNRLLAGYAADPALRAVVDNYEVYFVPMVNPDGVEYVWNVNNMWRKNRRPNGSNFGVDLNRNYPFLWGMCGASTNTGSDIYRGPSAGSEPEVRTMRNLSAFLRPEIYLDFHSSGREVLDTYAPCATVNSTMGSLIARYRNLLRAPMNYNFRNPSASGEAPEDHWASGGALSYLTEVGTSFQPVFSPASPPTGGSTVEEEARVWPGVEAAITTFRPAVRGHVRTIQNQPLDAAVSYTPNLFNHGEQTRSRARDGRYGLWLPLGTWNVTYSAPGYQSRTKSVTVSQYDVPVTLEIQLEPVWPASTITKSGSERIGTTVAFTYTSPGDAGSLYFVGWSLGTSPGTDLGGCRVLPLNHDFLLDAALSGNPFLTPTWGVLDGASRGQSALHIPNQPWAVGVRSWITGITVDPTYNWMIKKWSPPLSVTPLP